MERSLERNEPMNRTRWIRADPRVTDTVQYRGDGDDGRFHVELYSTVNDTASLTKTSRRDEENIDRLSHS